MMHTGHHLMFQNIALQFIVAIAVALPLLWFDAVYIDDPTQSILFIVPPMCWIGWYSKVVSEWWTDRQIGILERARDRYMAALHGRDPKDDERS